MIAFVILNYNSFELTKNCIKHINNNVTRYDKKIIVVDNNTLNEDEANEIKKICNKLILNKENVGFARGYNIGIRYAKNNYNPDLVCSINSDCLVNDDFINKIFNIYSAENFDIFGPKIESDDNLSFNPFPVLKTYENVVKKIKHYKKIDNYCNSLLYPIFKSSIEKEFKNNNKDSNGMLKEYSVGLDRCCIVFSNKYLNKYKDPFVRDTFLYHEEDFLYYRIMKDNLKSMYDPEIIIRKLHSGSIDKDFDSLKKKIDYINNCRLESLYKLKEKIEKDNK